MTKLNRYRVLSGFLLITIGCGVLSASRDTIAQNPNGPPGLTGKRVPPSISSIDFARMEHMRGRDILDLDPVRVSYYFDGALRNPARFQQDALNAAFNILRSAPGSPQAAVADAYATVARFRMGRQVDQALQQQLAKIAAQYPNSPAVAMVYQSICEDLIARGEHQSALELLDYAKKNAVNDQHRQWFSDYADFVRKGFNAPNQEPAGNDVAHDDGRDGNADDE